MRASREEIVCNICGEPADRNQYRENYTIIHFTDVGEMEIFDLCEDCEAVIRRTVLSMMGYEE